MRVDTTIANNDVKLEIQPLARNKSLSEPVDLLKKYKKDSSRKRRGHIKSESYYRSLNTGLLITAGVISALSGAISLGSAAETTPSKTYIFIAGAMGMISTIVTTLQGVFKPNTKAIEHRGSQLRYGTIIKEVEKMLVKDRNNPNALEGDVEKIIEVIEYADENAPSFPKKHHKYAISISDSPSVSRNR